MHHCPTELTDLADIGGACAAPGTAHVIGWTGRSAAAEDRFPRRVIALAVCWYVRNGLSYRNVEEPSSPNTTLGVDHVTIYRSVPTATTQLIEAARPARHATGDRSFVYETYVEIAG